MNVQSGKFFVSGERDSQIIVFAPFFIAADINRWPSRLFPLIATNIESLEHLRESYSIEEICLLIKLMVLTGSITLIS
jgi:hypothetical protein